MAQGHFIRAGDKTTCGGKVMEGDTRIMMFGIAHARAGDRVSCGKDDKLYEIQGGVSYIICNGKPVAGTLDSFSSCPCKARLIPSQITATYQSMVDALRGSARADVELITPAAFKQPPAPQQSGFASATKPFTPTLRRVSEQVCETLWRGYQQRAESVVAPGGRLITDPKARNSAINAAYAGLWLTDQRFQWAGLAAFASKQVGCGLLHAAESIDKIQREHETGQRLGSSAREGFYALFSRSERDRHGTRETFERARREHEQARRNNPMPSLDVRRDSELSLMQQQQRLVYEMLALGNTTLFLDLFPLHVFYKERGLLALEDCLPSRKSLYGEGKQAVLWPVGLEALEFGTYQKEILQAFQAINSGNIAESVVFLAAHEQVNILQPTLYSDARLVTLLHSNLVSYVTGFPSGAAQAIELTLASQCHRVDDGRTIGLGNNPLADLSDINQRMPFVLDAAARFDELLHGQSADQIEQSIRDVAAGKGVR